MSEGVDHHYVRAVTRLGDRRKVVANTDIHAVSGVKLVAKGVRVDSRLYSRLIEHKLAPPLDEALSVEDGFDHIDLARAVDQLLTVHRSVAEIVETTIPRQALERLLRELPLHPRIVLKMTLLRDAFPEQLRHYLLVMLLTLYLASRLGWQGPKLIDAALAGLLHDIGMLHIDPDILTKERHLDSAERRQLYAHPLIAYLILERIEKYQSIADAVLHHHERLDGSGYPQGLFGEEISELGRILAVTEVLASRIDEESGRCHCGSELEVMFKLNSDKLSPKLFPLLSPFFELESGMEDDHDTLRQERKMLLRKLQGINGLFLTWLDVSEQAREIDSANEEQLFRYIDGQLESLTKSLRGAGFNPTDLSTLLSPLDDSPDHDYQRALRAMLREADWQLKSTLHQVRRRWPEMLEGDASLFNDKQLGQWLVDAHEQIALTEERT